MRDAEKRRQLGALPQGVGLAIRRRSGAGAQPKPAHLSQAQYDQFLANSGYLWDHMADAPVILVPCLTKRVLLERASLPDVVQARFVDHIANTQQYRWFQHLSRGPEHHPGLPRAGPWHADNDQPHPL